MISYLTTYNADGSILRVISCPAHLISLQRLRPGESVLKGRGDSIIQKVIDGMIVNKTDVEIKSLREKSPKLRFENVNKKPETQTPLR